MNIREKVAAVAIAALALAGVSTVATTASAGGPDAPTPYSLEQDGLHMVSPLKDSDHLNVRRDDGETVNIHIEAKCADRTNAECAGKPGLDARWLGATFVPWSAFGVSADSCAVWVQHSGANWHYGEHGEPAYCPGKPTLDQDPTPDPDPVVVEDETVEAVGECVGDEWVTVTTVAPWTEVDGERTYGEPATTETREYDPTCDPDTPACGPIGSCGTVPEKAEDALEPSPEPTFAASSTGPIYATGYTPTATPAKSTPVPPAKVDTDVPVLAHTGAESTIPLALGALALVGAGALAVRRARV